MAKDKLTEYDATAANNTVVGDVNLAENSALPSDMNNAVREVMSHQKEAFGSGTPLYVDQTNNRVGVGTASPSTKIHLNESGSANAVQRIQAGVDGYAAQLHLIGNNVGGSAYNAIQSFVNADSTPQWEITGPEALAEDIMTLHTGGSERARVTSDGIDFRNATGTKYVLMKDGDGIHFGASSGSNATSTVLDDYEEGTFTPAYTSGVSGTYQTQLGTYTQVGRLVYVEIHIDGNSMSGDANQLKIGGLPFTSQNDNASNGGLYHVYTGGTYDGGNTTTWLVNRNEAVVYAYNVNGATWKGNQMSDLNGGYRIAGFYQAAT